MIGATLCSGIGAPEMAAPWVDWRFASEIEPFPRAVLEQRFDYRPADRSRNVTPALWGDFTTLRVRHMRRLGIPFPEIIVAGTPCQAFSVAGARGGLGDARGNLTLQFVRTIHAIRHARTDGRLAVLWENVPGVLSDKSNAFGCFLAGAVGADDPFTTPDGGAWPKCGMVAGPLGRAAWRVLDAQYFGVPQRRRRVFVVVDLGGALDPAAVLFERQGVRGNTPPRRKTGQDVAGTLSARSEGGGGLGTDFELAGGVQEHRWPADIAPTLNANYGNKMGLGNQHALGGAGLFVPVAFDCKGTQVQHDTIAPPLRSMGHDGSHQNAGGHAAVAFAENQRGELRVSNDVGALRQGGGKPGQGYPAVAIGGNDTHTLTHEGHDASEDGTGRGTPVVAVQERAVSENQNAGPDGVGCRDDGASYTLEARTTAQAVAYDLRGREGGEMLEGPHETANLRAADGGSSRSYVSQPVVRRLMPVECERLQGFPDNWTLIDRKGKPAADGPRYKALGNSMAVPCIKWIMDRMRVSMEAQK